MLPVLHMVSVSPVSIVARTPSLAFVHALLLSEMRRGMPFVVVLCPFVYPFVYVIYMYVIAWLGNLSEIWDKYHYITSGIYPKFSDQPCYHRLVERH